MSGQYNGHDGLTYGHIMDYIMDLLWTIQWTLWTILWTVYGHDYGLNIHNFWNRGLHCGHDGLCCGLPMD